MKYGHFNSLSPAEAERLAILAEECGELIQAIGKVLRHGYGSETYGSETNRMNIEQECGDVRYAMLLLCGAGDLSKEAIHAYADSKTSSIKSFLHHQEILD